MMSCKKVTQLLSRQLDRKLSAREAMAVKLHLIVCTGCTNFKSHMGLLRKACQRIVRDTGTK